MEGQRHHPYRTTLVLASVPVQAALMATTAALALSAFAHSQAASAPAGPAQVLSPNFSAPQPTWCEVVQANNGPNEAPASVTVTQLPVQVSPSGGVIAYVKVCGPNG